MACPALPAKKSQHHCGIVDAHRHHLAGPRPGDPLPGWQLGRAVPVAPPPRAATRPAAGLRPPAPPAAPLFQQECCQCRPTPCSAASCRQAMMPDVAHAAAPRNAHIEQLLLLLQLPAGNRDPLWLRVFKHLAAYRSCINAEPSSLAAFLVASMPLPQETELCLDRTHRTARNSCSCIIYQQIAYWQHLICSGGWYTISADSTQRRYGEQMHLCLEHAFDAT